MRSISASKAFAIIVPELMGRILGRRPRSLSSLVSLWSVLLSGVSSPVARSSAHTVGKRSGELARKQKKLTSEVRGPPFTPRQWKSRAGDHPKISFEGPVSAEALKSLSKRLSPG